SPASTFGGCHFFDSVHVSAYSLSGHDTPKSFTDPQDGLPGRLPMKWSAALANPSVFPPSLKKARDLREASSGRNAIHLHTLLTL
ncbi:hypothetical protein, partial [Paraburkholderia sp. JHI869]|uniref:hypothetical protein n=1 Tax=Paraburkholderia sp. JHI869 TaxID=3112959 RepID=UPI00318111EC